MSTLSQNRRSRRRPDRIGRAADAAIQMLEPRVLMSATLLQNVSPQVPQSGTADSVTIGNEVYFAANDGVHGEELWKSDGTAAGTVMVDDINPGAGSSNPANLTSTGGDVFFTADDGLHGTELWKSDGTAAGTVMVDDINPGAASSNPANLTLLNNEIYFSANDGTHGDEVWATNGTASGTSMLFDFNPGPASSNPTDLVAYPSGDRGTPGALYFIATGSSGTPQLYYCLNGGPNPEPVNSNLTDVSDLTVLNRGVFFAANDGVHGTELWSASYGSSYMVDDINPGPASSDPTGLYAFNNQLYFSAEGEMWKTDGTTQNTVAFTGPPQYTGGTRFTPLAYASRGNTLHFVNYDPSSDSNSLWETDGTVAGTKSIAPTLTLGYYNPQIIATESEVYFIAGNQLYQTGGTTVSSADPGETTAGWSPTVLLGEANNTLVFGATSSSGNGVWGLAVPSNASASFVKTDNVTQGSWEGVYGSESFVMEDNFILPPFVQFQPVDNPSTYTWAASTNDPRALTQDYYRQANPTNAGVANCYYSATQFGLNFNFIDGGTHQVALYLVDWDYRGRSETVQITDATNGQVLSTQNVSDFENGRWLVYNLSGDVTINFINDGGVNAVVSGVFFDPVHTQAPGTAAYVNTDTTTGANWSPTYGNGGYQVYSSGASDIPASISLSESGEAFYDWQTNTSDPRALIRGLGSNATVAGCVYSSTSFSINLAFNDGQAHQLALYLVDYDNRGRSETVQLTDALSGAVLDSRVVSNFSGGEYLVYNVSGNVKISVSNNPSSLNAVLSGLFINPVQPPPASAQFVKTDSTTMGTWTGVYGNDGYDVINASQNLPSYATINFVSAVSNYTWNSNTAQASALQDSPGSSARIAACDYSDNPGFSFELNLNDGKTHQVALYLLDWDARNRAETIKITDSHDNVLDTETVSNFISGKYLVWNLTGNVMINVTNAGGLNPVMSGIFFG